MVRMLDFSSFWPIRKTNRSRHTARPSVASTQVPVTPWQFGSANNGWKPRLCFFTIRDPAMEISTKPLRHRLRGKNAGRTEQMTCPEGLTQKSGQARRMSPFTSRTVHFVAAFFHDDATSRRPTLSDKHQAKNNPSTPTLASRFSWGQ